MIRDAVVESMIIDYPLDDVLVNGGSMTSSLTAAVGGDATIHTTGMVALIPSEADLNRLAKVATEPREELHLTLYFLGEVANYSGSDRQMIIDAVSSIVTGTAPITGNVFGAAEWNTSTEPVLILNVSAEGLSDFQDEIEDCIEMCCSMCEVEPVEQHEPWIPHITLSYAPTDALLHAALQLSGPITFDRVRVVFAGNPVDIPLTGMGNGMMMSASGAFSAAQADAESQRKLLSSQEKARASGDIVEFAWDGGANERRLPSPLPVGKADAAYAYVDHSRSSGGNVPKDACKLLHHDIGADGSVGAANSDGCSAGIGAIHGARSPINLNEDQKRTAYNHLAAHLRAMGKVPPPFATADLQSMAKAAKSPMASGEGMKPGMMATEEMGGKPKPGGKKDRRLAENKYVTDTVAADTTDLGDIQGSNWQGVLVVEGVETGDGRVFAEGSLSWDQPPMALRWTPTDEGQHKGAVVVARIDNVWRDETNPAIIRGEGTFDDHGVNGAEALRLVRGQFLKGVSVDVDSVKDADVELVFPEQSSSSAEDDVLAQMIQTPEKMIFHAGRIRAATLCDIPAFTEAQVWLTDGTMSHIAASVTPPSAGFAELNSFFAHNCTGDVNITACAVGIRALLSDAKLPISLSRRRTMYDHLASHLQKAGLTPLAFDPSNFSNDMVALVAGLVPQDTEAPPAAWFTDPELSEPTPITITDDGRIFGHGALWNSCHTGFSNACVSPPSEGMHTYYRQGELVTREGHHVAVGHITLGTGHAPTFGIDARKALEHYDNTGTVVADVISGEDEHGIWVSGALRPGLPPARIRELRAAKLSGDWRRIGGQLRLVAFLAVNVPGFGVPRLRAEIEDGRQLSLVASGMLRGNEIEVREAEEQRAALNNIREHLQKKLGLTPAQRAQALRERVLGEV